LSEPFVSRGRVGLLTLLALLSGSCALAYEILYMRALTTLLGDMLYVHSALLSTFLVGIGLGAKLARRGVRWLWAFEIATGVFALGFPFVMGWISDTSLLAAVTSSPGLTILLTILFLSIPSLLIGFSIPLFSAYIKQHAPEHLAFQGVYIAYNLGALLSILAVEFFLVRSFGVSRSLATIGAINLLNGIVLLAFREAPSELPREMPRTFSRQVVVALALGSIASAAFQMFFLKLTYLVFHPHRENFAIGLSVTMLGIFLGAWIASRVRVRFETFLALVPVVLGLTYVLYLPILDFYQGTTLASRGSELSVVAHKFAFGCLFALGPMILFGTLIPSIMRRETEVAGESGHLLWVSSLANAVGYLAYVLLGHPLLTTDLLLVTIGGLCLVASLLAAGMRWSRPQAAIAAASVVLLVTMAGLWQERNFYLAPLVDTLKPQQEVTVFKSGAESATLLRSDKYEWISYNGHPSIYVQREGVVTLSEMVSGVIPALTAPTLERALVLGLGTGITGGTTATIFDHTDIVEINNAFYKMMPHLSHANLAVGENPAAELHLADGRAFFVGKENTYDAIVNSIPAPTYYSASKIYTMEFYARVVRALKPDGVFSLWLAPPNMSEEGVLTVLSALRANFDYCDLRLVSNAYYMATCSNVPVKTRPFGDLPVRLDLIDQLQEALPGFDLREFFEDIRLSDNIFESFNPVVEQENTDDHPVLEFMVVRNFQLGSLGGDPFLDHQGMMNIDPVRREALDSLRLARRATVFYWLSSAFYPKNFLPLLKADPVAWNQWQQWFGPADTASP